MGHMAHLWHCTTKRILAHLKLPTTQWTLCPSFKQTKEKHVDVEPVWKVRQILSVQSRHFIPIQYNIYHHLVGWANTRMNMWKDELSLSLAPHFSYRDEITVQDSIALCGKIIIIIPSSMSLQMNEKKILLVIWALLHACDEQENWYFGLVRPVKSGCCINMVGVQPSVTNRHQSPYTYTQYQTTHGRRWAPIYLHSHAQTTLLHSTTIATSFR